MAKRRLLTSTALLQSGEPSTSGADIVDIAAFQQINEQMQEYDENREKVIKDSRGMLRLPLLLMPCRHVGPFCCLLLRIKTSETVVEAGACRAAALRGATHDAFVTCRLARGRSVCKLGADTQKLSKQAIYCLHRGDIQGAEKKLKAAMDAADKLKPVVEGEPSLRNGGSFSSAMEEVRRPWPRTCTLRRGRGGWVRTQPKSNADATRLRKQINNELFNTDSPPPCPAVSNSTLSSHIRAHRALQLCSLAPGHKIYQPTAPKQSAPTAWPHSFHLLVSHSRHAR